jgi:hypothetical protein
MERILLMAALQYLFFFHCAETREAFFNTAIPLWAIAFVAKD